MHPGKNANKSRKRILMCQRDTSAVKAIKKKKITFTILGVSDASDSKSGSSMTNESICWATGASGSVSESSALCGPPFFLLCGWQSGSAGVRVRETAAAGGPPDAAAFEATFSFAVWITDLKCLDTMRWIISILLVGTAQRIFNQEDGCADYIYVWHYHPTKTHMSKWAPHFFSPTT